MYSLKYKPLIYIINKVFFKEPSPIRGDKAEIMDKLNKLDILGLLDSDDSTSLSLAEMLRRTTYDELIEIDLKTRRFRILDHVQSKYRGVSTDGGAERFVLYSADNYVHPDDRSLYLEMYDLNDLVGRLEERGGAYAENIRILGVNDDWVQTRQLLVYGPIMDLPDDLVYIFIYDIKHKKHRIGSNDTKSGNVYSGHTSSPDEVTGLLVGFDFFKTMHPLLKTFDDSWCVIDLYIENFKLIMDWYGLIQGRYLLSQIGKVLKDTAAAQGGYAGYMGRESFCVVMPYDEGVVQNLYDRVHKLVSSVSMMDGFRPVMGIAMIDGSMEYMQEYYNRADLTSKEIENSNEKQRIRLYDADLHRRNLYEYEIAYQFREAMEAGQITFWLQPQVRVSNGKLVGAEALARWIKDDGSMISPGVFVPVLEKYKLVTELDKFIWESVCKWMSRWKAKGRKAVPVSINVSQLDATALDLPEYIARLLARYGLTPEDIKIEFTETAMAEDTEAIHESIRKLRDMGFLVMMDDFGSGYSSLNMLRKFSVDMIKLDAAFLGISHDEREKGISILESVMNMTTRLSTPIIAEGVEREQQMIFLRDYGCRYMQGYYFFRPMPIEQFEELIADGSMIESSEIRFKFNQQMSVRELFDENIYSDSMLNSILGPVAFYRWKGDNVDIVRFNEQFYEMVGIDLEDMEQRINGIQDFIYPPDKEKFYELLQSAADNYVVGARDVIRVYKPNGVLIWIMLNLFYLSDDDDGTLFYVSASDVTDLQLVNSGLPGGYCRCSADGGFEFLHISNNLMELVGYDAAEIRERFDNKLINLIHPDDADLVVRQARMLMDGEELSMTPYRLRRKRGDYIYVADQSILTDKFGALCWQTMLIDITDVMKMRNQMLLLTEYYKSTIFFLHREDGMLIYDIVVNGLEKALGMSGQQIEDSLNSGEFCTYIEGYDPTIAHKDYTELFIRETAGGQKKIHVTVPGREPVDIFVRADKVEDKTSSTEYIVNLTMA